MPPNVPAERVNAIRRAFDATMKDKEFLAEADKLKIEIDPLSGEQVAALIEQIYKTPAGRSARARRDGAEIARRDILRSLRTRDSGLKMTAARPHPRSMPPRGSRHYRSRSGLIFNSAASLSSCSTTSGNTGTPFVARRRGGHGAARPGRRMESKPGSTGDDFRSRNWRSISRLEGGDREKTRRRRAR